ncbi:hypothetical protein E2C01_056322 [Portunus trituberculatus]|uniref:Uncharacterized protein n=1 Tax=Portunus trituberculatus TaxID=210409 RepID=A0A5B7GXF8_PORTR|nr:hypothetical protein [Portunus trituberculatus]
MGEEGGSWRGDEEEAKRGVWGKQDSDVPDSLRFLCHYLHVTTNALPHPCLRSWPGKPSRASH